MSTALLGAILVIFGLFVVGIAYESWEVSRRRREARRLLGRDRYAYHEDSGRGDAARPTPKRNEVNHG